MSDQSKEHATANLPGHWGWEDVTRAGAPLQEPSTPKASAPTASSPGLFSRITQVLLLTAIFVASGFATYKFPFAPKATTSTAAARTPETSATRNFERKARPRAVVDARVVADPVVKEAAEAFSRGDHQEALAQYRALATLDPNAEAYRSLVRVLEHRLTRKP